MVAEIGDVVLLDTSVLSRIKIGSLLQRLNDPQECENVLK